MKNKLISVLTLFTSISTLLCCALPATISAISGGAAVAAMISSFPWLILLSKNKAWIFLIAGILILLNAMFVFRPKRNLGCHLAGENGCEISGNFSRITLYIAIGIYLLGSFFSYILVPTMVLIRQSL